MALQTIQQKRAAYALQQVQGYAAQFDPSTKEGRTQRKKFKSRASELPFMIHANGLGQALAFFRSKGHKDGYDYLFAILSGWLMQEERRFSSYGDALEGVVECDRATYMAAQVEAILLMEWVKKFASAFMETSNMEASNMEASKAGANAGERTMASGVVVDGGTS